MSSKHVEPLQKKPVHKLSRSISSFSIVANKLAWGETYLANYNAISAFAWFNIPLRLIQIYKIMGPSHFYETADFVRYVQTLAVLELVHSATGIIDVVWTLIPRTCSCSDYDDFVTSFLPNLHCMGDCATIPTFDSAFVCISSYVVGMECYRGDTIFFLCVEYT